MTPFRNLPGIDIEGECPRGILHIRRREAAPVRMKQRFPAFPAEKIEFNRVHRRISGKPGRGFQKQYRRISAGLHG